MPPGVDHGDAHRVASLQEGCLWRAAEQGLDRPHLSEAGIADAAVGDQRQQRLGQEERTLEVDVVELVESFISVAWLPIVALRSEKLQPEK